ncbi:MAG: holin, BlyA family protein [Lachnospiraceae bacterium]|nr:holin, BlyA family protein [Lachnospiraceae bacterium]
MLVRFFKEEDAVGTVEIILILVVLIALVTLFKKQITSLVEYLLGNVIKNAKAV